MPKSNLIIFTHSYALGKFLIRLKPFARTLRFAHLRANTGWNTERTISLTRLTSFCRPTWSLVAELFLRVVERVRSRDGEKERNREWQERNRKTTDDGIDGRSWWNGSDTIIIFPGSVWTVREELELKADYVNLFVGSRKLKHNTQRGSFSTNIKLQMPRCTNFQPSANAPTMVVSSCCCNSIWKLAFFSSGNDVSLHCENQIPQILLVTKNIVT